MKKFIIVLAIVGLAAGIIAWRRGCCSDWREYAGGDWGGCACGCGGGEEGGSTA